MSEDVPDLQVRRALPQDAETISALAMHVFFDTYAENGMRADLAREAFQNYSADVFRERLKNVDRLVLAAERQGSLTGFADFRTEPTTPSVGGCHGIEIVHLYVQPPFQRRGVGRMLLSAVCSWAADHGHSGIWLTTWCENRKALAFYHRQGFQDIGPIPFVFEDQVYENRLMLKRITCVQSTSDR